MELDNRLLNKKSKGFKNVYLFGIVLIAIYVLSQILPPLWVLDSTSMKFFVFSVLNVVSIVFLLVYSIRDKQFVSVSIFRNKISFAWLLLIGMMFLSFFQSMNVAESVVTVNRWIVIYLLFIYFSFFFSKKPSLFNAIIKLTIFISIINILWCIIAYYYLGAHINPRMNLYINGFYGNKNIFAAAILFKLPFLYYAFIFRKNWERWISIFLIFGLTFCLVILSARTSFLGLVFQLSLLLGYSIFVVLRFKRSKNLILTIGFLIGSALLGFFAGDSFIKYNFNHYCAKTSIAKSFGSKDSPYSVSNRFKSIEEGNSKGRLIIWKNTVSIIKDKPWLGYGVGNHKLAIMRVEASQKPNFVVSDHAHNDFLEMWSELGVFGLISYLLLFFSALVLFLKTLFKRGVSENTRFISFAGFLCIITYMNDALFNFPLERADCQLYLALGMSLILVAYIKTKREINPLPTKKFIIIIIGFITIGLTTVETMHYVSSVLQKTKILQTNGYKRIKITADQWNVLFPVVPTVDENVNPIAMTKAMRFDAEKKWRQAVDVIINDKSNPYLGLREYRLSNYYFKLNMLDSTEYWARECMAMKPLCYDPVRMLYRKYNKLKEYEIADTIISNFILKYKFTTNAWTDLATIKTSLNREDEAIKVLDSALYYLPWDSKINKMRREFSCE
ncbi:MAG: O-antigen ligase family protein [Bacteroidales bacterium]|nr:O-antigen ligase family protein [Bacteroidales bacterium]